jgi:hypothetical protein
MKPQEIKQIDWNLYREKMSQKLDYILEKDEMKQIFMPYIQSFKKNINFVEINRIMEEAAKKSNLL